MLASQRLSPSVTGGRDGSLRAQAIDGSRKDRTLDAMQDLIGDEPLVPTRPTLLDVSDAEAFRALNEMVIRQEPLAKSRLAQDIHWTAIKLGYPFSSLEKTQNQDAYQQNFPPGYTLRIAAVPNKAADLCQKLVETMLVDAPKPDPEPLTDGEAAVKGAQMAREFLHQTGGEDGTNDLQQFAAVLEKATTCASGFLYLWVDETGGGKVAKQIRAHPEATDPANPLVAVDPMTGMEVPTTDYVLRYVTAGDEESPAQFTDSPADAEAVWVPCIRVEKLGREHVRFFPETTDVDTCESVILLRYCTVGQARKRWPETVGTYTDEEISALVAWSPNRAAAILPVAIRARWRQASAVGASIAGGADDERIVFYYAFYRIADPLYPQGAQMYVSGADGGTTLGKGGWEAEVNIPSGTEQDQEVRDVRGLDIPLAQFRLLQDVDDGDPMGKAVMSRVGGAAEASSTLMTGLLTALDKTLNPARFVMATSPLSDEDIEGSRGSGRLAVVMSKDDAPVYEQPPTLPALTMNAVDWNYQQMDSAIGLNKPAQGADDSNEVSGVARRIAVQQSMVAVSRMAQSTAIGCERFWRIKLQLATKSYSVPQMLRFVGVDGASKEQWFTGNNFAQVGGVKVAPGSLTMMPPNEKINYALQLRDAGLEDPDAVAEFVRPAFAKQLGAPANPHVERIERQISSFLEGPPDGWVEQAEAFEQAQMQAPMMDPMTGQPMLEPMAPQVPEPWTPFAPLPVDAEPAVAALRFRKLGHLMARVSFTQQPRLWQATAIAAWSQMKQAMQPPMPPIASSGPPSVGGPEPEPMVA